MAKKTGFRIGEVCRELDLQPYVLRYWETEFPVLQAPAGAGSQRSYSEREVQVLRRVKRLLYEEGYTIAGAKKKLDAELAAGFTSTEAGGSLFAVETAGEAVAASGVGEAAAAPKLDSARAQRIEQLRSGLATALEEARALQSSLRAGSDRKAD